MVKEPIRPLWTIIILILVIALGCAFALYHEDTINYLNDMDDSNFTNWLKKKPSPTPPPTASPTTSVTPSPSLTPSPTVSPTSLKNIKAAKTVAGKYLAARITRDLANAKPYMTDEFYAKMTQEEFAGVSSPSMGKYKVLTAQYLSAADQYKVKARIYWYLQGKLTDTSIWTFYIIKEDDEFLVNDVKGSY